MKDVDRIQDARYLQTIFQVRDEITPIISKISQAKDTDKRESQFEAISEVLGKLSLQKENLSKIPESEGSNTKKLREIQQLEEKALDTFIDYCQSTMEYLKEPKRFRQAKTSLKLSRANGYWDSSVDKAVTLLRK